MGVFGSDPLQIGVNSEWIFAFRERNTGNDFRSCWTRFEGVQQMMCLEFLITLSEDDWQVYITYSKNSTSFPEKDILLEYQARAKEGSFYKFIT